MSAEPGMRISSVAAPVRQQVAAAFRAAICSGRFAPGDRLIEKELCELTGASRTSVREALRQLETEGLVAMIPNKGPIVAAVDPLQARSLYEIRAALESLAGALFTVRATAAQMQRLEAAAAEVLAAYASGTIDAVLEAKDGFYAVLIEGSENTIIASLLQMMHARISLLRRISLGRPGRRQASAAELEEILAAVKTRDPAAVEAACRHHILQASAAALGEKKASATPS